MSILSLHKLRGTVTGSKSPRYGELIESDLLARVFQGMGQHSNLRVLDVGKNMANTLEFLNRFPCKVFFLDLETALQSEAPDAIGKLLADCSEELFDVCLFWDLLHRLEAGQLTELSEALEPYIYSKTQAYSALNYVYPNECYRLISANQLQVDVGPAQVYRLNSVTQLEQNFRCMELQDDAISADGRVELLLQTR